VRCACQTHVPWQRIHETQSESLEHGSEPRPCGREPSPVKHHIRSTPDRRHATGLSFPRTKGRHACQGMMCEDEREHFQAVRQGDGSLMHELVAPWRDYRTSTDASRTCKAIAGQCRQAHALTDCVWLIPHVKHYVSSAHKRVHPATMSCTAPASVKPRFSAAQRGRACSGADHPDRRSHTPRT